MHILHLSFVFLFAPVLAGSLTPRVVYKVGVLMASRLDSPFDLERCGPAVDLALSMINEKFLAHHGIELQKVQGRFVIKLSHENLNVLYLNNVGFKVGPP